MKPAAFEYHAPSQADEAVRLLAEYDETAKILAGGQSLIPLLAMRLAAFEHLIDIGRIEGLTGIERRDAAVWVGAGTTEAMVERSAEVAAAVPLLARATPLIGHFQIRNRGTVGGSIAHADPAAELPAVALTLDAEMEALSPGGRRTIAASEFFTGTWSTSMRNDELLVGIRFPVWSGRCGFAVQEFARRHGDFAIAGATIALELDGADTVRRCAIGLIGLGSTPVRATAAEREITGKRVTDIAPDEVGRLAVGELGYVPSDLHGSATYRTRVGAAMVARAWADASSEALGGEARNG